MLEWLFFSLIFFSIWGILFFSKLLDRKEMLKVSVFTAFFGLTEPLFVPAYWNPPSLFNLATKTGFDVESIIFSFAIGGIGSVLYESIFRVRHYTMKEKEILGRMHRMHRVVLVSPVIVLLFLTFFTSLNPIYSASIAMFVGALASLSCRPDLKKKIWVGGSLFLGLYFLFFLLINLLFPNFVYEAWNLAAISGILVVGIPLEELIFAFTFGMLWSSIYEHVMWRKVVN